MRIDQLTQEILNELFEIYKEITGCLSDRYPSIKMVKQDFIEGNCSEWRVGSKFSGHSKFEIYNRGGELQFVFYPNYTSNNKEEEKQIKKTELEFEKKIADYLRKRKPNNKIY